MKISKRHYLVAVLVGLFPGLASAQQPPTEPAPATGSAAEPADQAPPAGATTPAEAETAPPLAAEAPPVVEEKKDEKPAVTAKYDGGTRLSSADEKFEMKLSLRNQTRFESNRSLDEETPVRHNQFLNRFYIPRTRLQIEGHAFGKDNRYKLEFGVGDSGSFSFVKEMWLDKRLPDSPLYIRVGQWRRPFNRQELVSDFASTFNERSIQNDLAGGGRDLGIAVHNDYEKSPEGLEWVVGLFNGFNGGSDRPAFTTACTSSMSAITCTNSRPSNFPTDFGPTLAARVGWNSPKLKGYAEGDLEGGPLRYGVGLAYKVDFGNFAKQKEESKADNMSHGLELDAIIKAMGYAFHGGVVMMKVKSADAEYGVFGQPTMMIIPKKAEIGLRVAMTTLTVADPMGGDPISRKLLETRLAFNYFWVGNSLKFASDVGYLTLTGSEPSEDGGDLQIRLMMQIQL